MPTTNRRRLRLNTVTVNLGCSCRRPSLLSSIFHPKPKSSSNKHNLYSSSSYTTTNTTTNTTTSFSPTTTATPRYSDADSDSDIKSLRAVQGFGRIGPESVAVEKDSDDPYLDFRRSMLQMIVENEIYSKEDLKELLNCFLQLNSPYYHGIIVRAFSEIWNGVFPAKLHGGGRKSRAF